MENSMFTRLVMFLVTIVSLTGSAHGGLWDNVKGIFSKESTPPPPTIKILIVHDQLGAVIEVKGKYSLFNPLTNEHISSRYAGKRKFMQPIRDGLKWSEEFPGIFQLVIVPENESITTMVNGIEYQGSIYVYDIGGSLSVVNEVLIENYLNSLLVPQFTEPMNKETLAAVAIAARTNAYYQALNSKTPYWSVDGRKIGYEGFAVPSRNSGINLAIQSTAYMIATKSDNSGQSIPFPAQWGSGTGGQSANDQIVFSRISLYDAEQRAQKGDDAVKILDQAFPGTKIELVRCVLPAKIQK